jgi:hypothetical protein
MRLGRPPEMDERTRGRKQYARRLHAQRAQYPVNLLQTVRGERLRAKICDDLDLLSSKQHAADGVDIAGREAFERACGLVEGQLCLLPQARTAFTPGSPEAVEREDARAGERRSPIPEQLVDRSVTDGS